MERHVFMRLKYYFLSQEIIMAYNLTQKALDGWVYVRIDKGMYGLLQAGLLAHKVLASCLDTDSYYQCQFSPGL